MRIYINQPRATWIELLKRPALDNSALREQVGLILNAVKLNGDLAIKQYTKQFDGVAIENNQVLYSEI